TSNSTFGSGTMFAEMIQDNGFGKIIGEQCSDFPDTYGEVVVFQTPNSVLSFQVSSKHFYRIDESKCNLPIEPDYVCTADQAEKVLLSILNSNILY
ncbi:MAG: peptidase S41, partial [Clostridia bacterium]|nr:peptidase S41 [Clostridia bacterium]